MFDGNQISIVNVNIGPQDKNLVIGKLFQNFFSTTVHFLYDILVFDLIRPLNRSLCQVFFETIKWVTVEAIKSSMIVGVSNGRKSTEHNNGNWLKGKKK